MMEELDKEFFSACSQGDVVKVQELLADHNININANCESSATIETPFYHACTEGQIEVVKLLLNDSRVDVNWVDSHGHTAFFIICRIGYTEIVKLLLNEHLFILLVVMDGLGL